MLKHIKYLALRLIPRTVILAVMTYCAFSLMLPVYHSTGWPEVMQILRASAILVWLEHTVFIVRVVFSSRIDMNHLATGCRPEVVYVVNMARCAFHLGVLLWLMQ